ncbi:hypothetical protein D3C73_1255690 [compost metagenome]
MIFQGKQQIVEWSVRDDIRIHEYDVEFIRMAVEQKMEKSRFNGGYCLQKAVF